MMILFPSGLLGWARWDASHLPWTYSDHQDQVLRCPAHHQGACVRSLRVSRCGGHGNLQVLSFLGPLAWLSHSSCLLCSHSRHFPEFFPLLPTSLALKCISFSNNPACHCGLRLSPFPSLLIGKRMFPMSHSQSLATTKAAVPTALRGPSSCIWGCFSSFLTCFLWNVLC